MFDLRRKSVYRWLNTAPTVWLHCRNYFWPRSTTKFCKKKKKGNFFAWVTVQRQFPGASKTVGGEEPLLKSEKRNLMWLKTGDAVWSPFTEPALDHCKAALPPRFPPSSQGPISLSTVWERTLGIVVRRFWYDDLRIVCVPLKGKMLWFFFILIYFEIVSLQRYSWSVFQAI